MKSVFTLSCMIAICLASSALYPDKIRPVIIPQSSLMETSLPLKEEDEVVVIDRLILATQAQLGMQKHLKELMITFQQQKEMFIQGDQSKKLATQMVRSAREILEIISDEKIHYLFSTDYLDELKMFSSIAGKNGIKRP